MKKKSILKVFLALTLGLFAFLMTNDVDAGAGGTLAMAGGMTTGNTPVLNTLAEKELIKHFRHKSTWLALIPSMNKWVNNDTIKFNEIGADPVVLIDNNTYPINTTSRQDGNVVISLYKYSTENTEVSEDEAYALPYDKVGSSQQQHRETLEEETQEHALHSLCTLTNSADTPVLVTTGEDDGTGRLRLTSKDLINFRKALNDRKVPKKGRMLVLCGDHVSDLLLEDLGFRQRYQNTKDGEISANYYGFQIFEDVYNPVFYDNGGTLEKRAYGAAVQATDRNASVAIYLKNAGKATGSAKRYLAKAENDPQNRKTVLGFDLYAIAIPKKWKGFGAIIDGRA